MVQPASTDHVDGASTADIAARTVAVTALLRASEVASDHVNDFKRALALVEQALARDPANLAGLLLAEPLLRRAGNFEGLAKVLAGLSPAALPFEVTAVQQTIVPEPPAPASPVRQTRHRSGPAS